MTHTTVRPGKWRAAGCAVLLSAAALFCAAPASANQVDDAFISTLAKNGIPISDRDNAIALAHSVCAGYDRGQGSSVMAMRLMKGTNLSPKQAGYFIGLSVSAYCPQHKGDTDGSVIWLLPQFPMTQ